MFFCNAKCHFAPHCRHFFVDENPMPRALIFANGNLPVNPPPGWIQPQDTLLAADGGARHCRALGITPHLILGDLDSLPPADLDFFRAQNVPIEQYPAQKDQTDLELTLAHALRHGYSPILIVAALGGRTDHTLANLALLSDPALAHAQIRLDDGETEAFFIRDSAEVSGNIGETVSLLPWGAPVSGVTTEGLEYPLRGETLQPHQARGVSNTLTAARARISIQNGLLLCIHIRSRLNTKE
jgi:thiamine pyrophosphokinase